MLRTFRRSVHQICGHRIDLDPSDPDRAWGATYCRAEHEVDDRWIVMAICYFDDYQRVDGQWLFRAPTGAALVRRRHDEQPQAVGFDSWHSGAPRAPRGVPHLESVLGVIQRAVSAAHGGARAPTRR